MKLLNLSRLSLLAILAVTSLQAQTPAPLKLVPMPREVRPATALPVPNGVRILPATDVDDQFAESDFGQTKASRGIHATIGTTASSSFTVELLRVSDAAAQERMKAAQLTFDPA